MTEDLRQMAKELAIQSGSETNPAPVETQEAFCKEAKEQALDFLWKARTGKTFSYTYRRFPNRNLFKVLKKLPPLPKGSKYVFLVSCGVCFKAKEKSEYIIRVHSVTALRLKKWKYNPFGHFS